MSSTLRTFIKLPEKRKTSDNCASVRLLIMEMWDGREGSAVKRLLCGQGSLRKSLNIYLKVRVFAVKVRVFALGPWGLLVNW